MGGDDAFDEVEVCRFPEGCVAAGVTADGHANVLAELPDGTVRSVWDGHTGEPFDEVVQARDETVLYLSDDGRHIAYIGVRAGKQFVGHDGVEDPAYDGISLSVPPEFSADGQHLVYGALKDGTNQLIVDGQPISHEPLAPIAAAFGGPDGGRLAYVVMRDPGGPEAAERIVLDGEPGPWLAGMRNAPGVMQFSPDGSRFAYYHVDGKLHGQWVVDGVPQRWVDDVPPLSLNRIRGISVREPPLPAMFSPDGTRFVYWADVKEKGVAVIEDDVAGPIAKATTRPVFSRDSRRLGYVIQTFADRGAIVVDGVVGHEWMGTPADIVFSDDGRRVAASVCWKEGSFLSKRKICAIIVDDQIVGQEQTSDCSLWPVFSPDGQRVAWWMQRGEGGSQLFVDGAPVGDATTFSEPRFTPSGAMVYARGTKGEATVVIDGRSGPPSLEFLTQRCILPKHERDNVAEFRVSPVGDHVAWAGVFDPAGFPTIASPGSEPGWQRPVLDDRVGPAYDEVFSWSFDASGTATWMAQRGRSIIRVTAR